MDLQTFVPMYIRQVLDSKPRETITADRWNELWNLAITQGDHTSEIVAVICKDLDELMVNFNEQVQIIYANSLFRLTHANSTDHDVRYYTKSQLDPMLRSGDTRIREETFIIVNSNLGNGTFTYKDDTDTVQIGEITDEGHQVFTLLKGNYKLNENRITAIVGDTLHRSVGSGGLREIDPTHIALTAPEGSGAEVSFHYFEQIGISGEHYITHEIGQSDEVAGLMYVGTEPPPGGKAFWCKVVEE